MDNLLQAAFVPLSHLEHVFLSKKRVLHIQNLTCLRVTALLSGEFSVTSALKAQGTSIVAWTWVQCEWGAVYFGIQS